MTPASKVRINGGHGPPCVVKADFAALFRLLTWASLLSNIAGFDCDYSIIRAALQYKNRIIDTDKMRLPCVPAHDIDFQC